MTVPTTAAPQVDEPEAHGPFDAAMRRVRAGELGAWPVIIGLIVIWVTFQSLNSNFLTAQNLSNLALQIAGVGIISVGIVLVLLLGEIDLSVGSVAGLAAASLAVLAVRRDLPDVVAIVLVLGLGALIGVIHGTIFARLGVPAFVVTLAGNLGWLGLQLYLLSPQGTINIPFDSFIGKLATNTIGSTTGWIIGAVLLGVYAFFAVTDRTRRLAAGLPSLSMQALALRIISLAIIIGAVVSVLNSWRGVPIALLIFVGLVAVMDLILRRTRYGRTVYALGGNVEAARRAGINVTAIRISVFALASTFAAFGGVMIASRNFAAGQSTGGGEVLLVAIASAVIGGVSLFGGRGSPWGALLGALVIGSITSGMFLLQLESSVRFMITAAVLLAAVILDSLSRRGRQSHGRA